jgi:hypothetical protein
MHLEAKKAEICAIFEFLDWQSTFASFAAGKKARVLRAFLHFSSFILPIQFLVFFRSDVH